MRENYFQISYTICGPIVMLGLTSLEWQQDKQTSLNILTMETKTLSVPLARSEVHKSRILQHHRAFFSSNLGIAFAYTKHPCVVCTYSSLFKQKTNTILKLVTSIDFERGLRSSFIHFSFFKWKGYPQHFKKIELCTKGVYIEDKLLHCMWQLLYLSITNQIYLYNIHLLIRCRMWKLTCSNDNYSAWCRTKERYDCRVEVKGDFSHVHIHLILSLGRDSSRVKIWKDPYNFFFFSSLVPDSTMDTHGHNMDMKQFLDQLERDTAYFPLWVPNPSTSEYF